MLNRLNKSTKVINAVALLLSVAFAGMVAGPVIVGATALYTAPPVYNPPTPPQEDPYSFNPETGTYSTPEPPIFVPTVGAVTPPAATPPPTIQEKQKGAADAAARELNQAEALAAAFSCSILPPTNLTGCLAWVMDQAMWLSARTLWIAGVLFNITLDYTLNLNTLLEKLPVVDIGWKVLRDISNIIFIFVVLYAGISITLGIGGGKPGWGLIANVVLVALFINFSLFISKAVVDASNVAALHFYSLIVKQSGDPKAEKKYDKGLSEAFLYGLQLSTIYNSKQLGAGGGFDAGKNSLIASAGKGAGRELNFTNIILIGFFGSVFIITTAWVFFAAAIMFIYRAITLIFLMMTSPLAFVGLILPGASGMAHQWWSKLWSQAFFAPLYLALAYVVAFTINTPAFRDGLNMLASGKAAPSFAAAITGTGADTVAVIFNFVILIGLMVGCLMVAQQLGAKGSDMAMAGWEKIKGGAINVAGAGVRGIIKAPSAGVRAIGGAGSGAAATGLGKWMTSTRLLNNRWMQSGTLNKLAKKGGEALQKTGTSMQESTFGKTFGKVADKTGKALDVRHLEERAGQSWLGNTQLGKALRAVTIGGVANLKIGDKSLEEAHKEGELNETARHIISLIAEARGAGNALRPLREDEHHKREDAFTAEERVKQAEAAVTQRPPLTVEQQADVTTAEAELAEAKEVSPEKQRRIEAAKENLTDTEHRLAQAKEAVAVNPNDTSAKLKVLKLEQELGQRQKALAAAGETSPEEKERIAAAEKRLVETRNPPLTTEQESAVEAAQKSLEEARKTLEAARQALTEFNDKHGKEIAGLVEKRSRAYAQMSSQEFVHYAPKEDKMNLDFESDPPGHYLAVKEDEKLTEREKEIATHNYVHRLVEEATRGEKRNERFNETVLKFQKLFGKNQKVMEAIEGELRLGGLGEQLKALKKQLEEAKEREEEEKKREKKKGGG